MVSFDPSTPTGNVSFGGTTSSTSVPNPSSTNNDPTDTISPSDSEAPAFNPFVLLPDPQMSILDFSKSVQNAILQLRQQMDLQNILEPQNYKAEFEAFTSNAAGYVVLAEATIQIAAQVEQAVNEANAAIDAYNNAANTFNTNYPNDPPTVESSINTYNTQYESTMPSPDEQSATDSMNAAITAVQSEGPYLTPAQTAAYQNAYNTYTSYANSRNSTLGPLDSAVNNVDDSYNSTFVNNANATIASINSQNGQVQIPSVPTAPDATLMPEPSFLALPAQQTITNPSPPPATITVQPAPPIPAGYQLPARSSLPVDDPDVDWNNWVNQVIQMHNNGQISDSDFTTLIGYYNNWANARNSDTSTDINAYLTAESQYAAEIPTVDAALNNANTLLANAGLPQITLPPSTVPPPTPNFLPTITSSQTASVPAPVQTAPTISDVQSIFGLGAYELALLSPVAVGLRLLNLYSNVLDTSQHYVEQRIFLLPGHSGSSQDTVVNYIPDNFIANGSGSSLGLSSISIDPTSPLMGRVLSTSVYESVLQNAFYFESNPALLSNLQFSALNVLAQTSVLAANITLGLLGPVVGSIQNQNQALTLTASLSSLVVLNNFVASGELNNLVSSIVANTLQQQGVTLTNEQFNSLVNGLSSALGLNLLEIGLTSLAVSSGLPGLTPQLLGNISGINPISVLLAATPNLRFGEILNNPISQALLKQSLVNELVFERGFTRSEAENLVNTAINNVLLLGPFSSSQALLTALENEFQEQGFNAATSRVLANAALNFVNTEITLPFLESAYLPPAQAALNQPLLDYLTAQGLNLNLLGPQLNLALANTLDNESFTTLRDFRDQFIQELRTQGFSQEDAQNLANAASSTIYENALAEAETQAAAQGGQISQAQLDADIQNSTVQEENVVAAGIQSGTLSTSILTQNQLATSTLEGEQQTAAIQEGELLDDTVATAQLNAAIQDGTITQDALNQDVANATIANNAINDSLIQASVEQQLIQQGVNQQEATALAQQAVQNTAAQGPYSNEIAFRNELAAQLLQSDQNLSYQQASEISTSSIIATQTAQNETNALLNIAQNTILTPSQIGTQLSNYLLAALTPSVGATQAQAITNLYIGALLPTPTASVNQLEEIALSNPNSWLSNFNNQLNQLKQTNEQAAEVLASNFRDFISPSLDLFALVQMMNDPGTKVVLNANTGLSYAQPQSLSSPIDKEVQFRI